MTSKKGILLETKGMDGGQVLKYLQKELSKRVGVYSHGDQIGYVAKAIRIFVKAGNYGMAGSLAYAEAERIHGTYTGNPRRAELADKFYAIAGKNFQKAGALGMAVDSNLKAMQEGKAVGVYERAKKFGWAGDLAMREGHKAAAEKDHILAKKLFSMASRDYEKAGLSGMAAAAALRAGNDERAKRFEGYAFKGIEMAGNRSSKKRRTAASR